MIIFIVIYMFVKVNFSWKTWSCL